MSKFPLRLSGRSLTITLIGFCLSADVRGAEIAKIIPSDAGPTDEFGTSIGFSSNNVVIGSWRDDGANLSSGSAYVFQRQTGSNGWTQVKKLIPSDGAAGDQFGGSVWIHNDLVIGGATGDDDFGSDSGSAYIFERTLGGATNWGQRVKLAASDAMAGMAFGTAVTVGNDVAAVGAPGGSGAGAVYIYQRDLGGPNAWFQAKKISPSSASAGAGFGYAVSLSGDTLAVGAWRDSDSVDDGGSVFIFQRNQGGPNQWGEIRRFTASDVEDGQNFGAAVALGGDTLIVGASDELSMGPGSAYLFERNRGGPNNWGEVTKVMAGIAGEGALFGASVAIEGDTAMIGAPGSNAGGLGAGRAYVYARHRGGIDNWGLVQQLGATDNSAGHHFGSAVALSGDIGLVGADGDGHAGQNAGSVYVFSPVSSGPNLSIARNGNQVTLSWTAAAPKGFVLETTPTLAPAQWTVAASGATNPVTVSTSGGSGFFRLAERATLGVNFIPIGNPSNLPDTGGLGGVNRGYQVGKFEVTNDEYTRFLNAVATTDAFGLYNPSMGTDPRGGITRAGSAGSFVYAVRPNMANKPVNFVSLYDALRFANWLHNQQPSGAQTATTTEGGAYTFTGAAAAGPRNSGAKVWVPNENEWYKAAYFDPGKDVNGGYWIYPTRSSTTPTPAIADAIGNISNAGVNVVNYGSSAGWNSQDGNVTSVGSAGSSSWSYYGIADMGGNVAEWTDTVIDGSAIIRGGAWGDFESNLESASSSAESPATENDSIGFRVARP